MLLAITLRDAFAFAGWAPFMREWQILFNRRYNVGIWIIGWLQCAQQIAKIAGAELAARTSGGTDRRGARLAAVTTLGGVMLGVAGLLAARPNAALAAIVVMQVCIGAMGPIAMSWINEEIRAGDRATLLSFNSTGGRLGGVVGLLSGGYMADRVGIAAQWKMSGLICLCAAESRTRHYARLRHVRPDLQT